MFVAGRRRGSSQVGKAMTDLGPKACSDLDPDFSSRLEPRQLDFSFMNWTDPDLGNNMLRESGAPAERLEGESGSDVVLSSVPRARKQQGKVVLSSEAAGKKSSSWPWTFKWKWGPKSRSKPAKGAAAKDTSMALPRPITSPTADIMTDARDTMMVSQSDRFSSTGTVAEKLACDRAPKHRRVLSWGAGIPGFLTDQCCFISYWICLRSGDFMTL